MIIEARYHVDREFTLVAPIDGRTGQLATNQIAAGDDQLDLGNVLNSHEVRAGDVFRFISNPSRLSGSVDAEVIVNNTGDFEVEVIAGNLVTFTTATADEPNSEEGKFFEYEIIRKSPYRKFTFARHEQVAFNDVSLFVSGVAVTPVVTNPVGEKTVVTWDGGTLTFLPLGDGRWSCEMAITIDGVIELVIRPGLAPTTVPGQDEDGVVEIRFSNINILQDAPLGFFSDDVKRFGSKLVRSVAAVERLAGAWWLDGEPPGVAVELAFVNFDRQRFVAGSTNETIFRIVTADNKFPPRLEGAVIFFEMRRQSNNEVVLNKECDNINAGVCRLTLIPEESVEGTYFGRIVIHLGGIPDKILRTPTFQVAIRS